MLVFHNYYEKKADWVIYILESLNFSCSHNISLLNIHPLVSFVCELGQATYWRSTWRIGNFSKVFWRKQILFSSHRSCLSADSCVQELGLWLGRSIRPVVVSLPRLYTTWSTRISGARVVKYEQFRTLSGFLENLQYS